MASMDIYCTGVDRDAGLVPRHIIDLYREEASIFREGPLRHMVAVAGLLGRSLPCDDDMLGGGSKAPIALKWTTPVGELPNSFLR